MNYTTVDDVSVNVHSIITTGDETSVDDITASSLQTKVNGFLIPTSFHYLLRTKRDYYLDNKGNVVLLDHITKQVNLKTTRLIMARSLKKAILISDCKVPVALIPKFMHITTLNLLIDRKDHRVDAFIEEFKGRSKINSLMIQYMGRRSHHNEPVVSGDIQLSINKLPTII